MADLVLKTVNGWAIHAASLKSSTGAARFNIEFPVHLVDDQGARHLILNDAQSGYELPTRNFLEKALRPGDLFIDVGAHWGFFTLQAVTHPAGGIRAVAFEPDPMNAAVLCRNVTANSVADAAQVVCAACGAGPDIAPLVANTSMGHSIRGVGLKPPFGRGPAKWVPVVALDTALAHVPHAEGRMILKVDAEGYEPQVLAGAPGLLDSGRVALIIWERGHAFDDGPEREALVEMIADLSRRGFQHFRPSDQHVDGPLLPFRLEEPYIGNVFSCGPKGTAANSQG
jgi:FkbM family methyltransferase